MRVLLLLGTKKGVFLAESDAGRERWELCGPLTSGTWAMYHVAFAPGAEGGGGSRRRRNVRLYAGGASNWYGPAVWWSDDLGQSWSHSSEGLTYGDDGPEITQVWCVVAAHGTLYAGVEPAGLFRSDDGGATWKHVTGLRRHPSQPEWRPAAGGLCLHAIVPHASDPLQLWAGISAGGVFYTRDGGETWTRCTAVVDGRASAPAALHPCVHALALAPGGSSSRSGAAAGDGPARLYQPAHTADRTGTVGAAGDGAARLYQQNHDGVYRSDDGGRSWCDVSEGLPSRYGFPLVVHPRDPQTLYVVPLESEVPGRRHVPGGALAVWRSRDGGAHWQRLAEGLPQERTSFSVLRGALAVDALEPAGIYLGTTTGQVYWSADEGERWRALPVRLPPIYSIAARAV